MNREDLVKDLRESLLWQVVKSNVEQLSQLHIMLKGIDYLDNKSDLISKITRCEVIKSEEFKVRKIDIEGSKILVYYTIPSFIIVAWSKESKLLRITATMKGLVAIPDIDQYDWYSKDFNDMSKEELLENKSLVYILETSYENIECDDMRFMD